MKKKIWNLVCNSKFKEYCLNEKVQQFQRYDRNINIITAISSSTSIAAWVIWENLDFVWGGIIAISQVINVVKPYFPFHKYIKELNSKLNKLENLNIDIEKLWTDYNDQKNKEKSKEKYFELKRKLVKIEKFNDKTIFKIDSKTKNLANLRMKVFLKNEYQSEINIK